MLMTGVLDVKNGGDWAMEKWSIHNKKDYAARHGTSAFCCLTAAGYELVVKDMSLKRKYAHEWRESWEKIDTIGDVMRQYPHHEWFWWLDLVSSHSYSVDNLAYLHHGALPLPQHPNLLPSR
jgi:mannan polymerase II complex MNN10 subunit